MLLYLTELLAKNVRTFNVFSYITLRAVLATMTALIISFIVGPKMIASFSARQRTKEIAQRMGDRGRTPNADRTASGRDCENEWRGLCASVTHGRQRLEQRRCEGHGRH